MTETPALTGATTHPGPRVSVVGTGYLGATHAVAMAALGFDVVGVDTDDQKIDALRTGKVPFYEPGLAELLTEQIDAGRLRFTTDLDAASAWADVHFVCVGTPQQATSHAANLAHVDAAVTGIARHLDHDALIVGKSTVPVGTAERLRGLIRPLVPTDLRVELVWNPEFLREGKAVHDTLHPDRIVVGGASAEAERTLRALYAQPLAEGTPFLTSDLATAELVKVSANAFLATKISFINAIAAVCEAAGGDVTVLADALGHDARIGRQFLDAGIGFGGGCLPKDIRALAHRARELGAHHAAALLLEVDEINMGQRTHVVQMALEMCGGSVLGHRVGVLGAAFKPHTDDVRDSPALNVAAALHLRGAQVTVFDPQAGDTAHRTFPTLAFATSVEECVEGTDVVLVLTEWEQFLHADPAHLARLAGTPRVIDGRGKLDASQWRAAGWEFAGLGRTAYLPTNATSGGL